MVRPKRLLVVVRWPLGGIRTYMRYVYKHLGRDWRVTILATDVQEREALREDANLLGAELILTPDSSLFFFQAILRILLERRHDLIQSHGFISAIATCVANIFFGLPHVLTVHGILEERLLQGVKGRIKRSVANVAIRSVDAVYGVSEDILEHLRQEVPGLVGSKVRQVAILNGIEPDVFLEPGQPGAFRKCNGLSDSHFLFGFLGRFMPQKGFDRIIHALAALEKNAMSRDYRIVAVGSGDCRIRYEKMAREMGVEHRIVFLPFQSNVAEIYRDLDAVLMPSRWEACGLLAMETLVSGVPIVTSDCIGLREVVRDTPAIMVPGGDPDGLARAMEGLMCKDHRQDFMAFRRIAAQRFDARCTASKVGELFEFMLQQ
jgi:glycosyltransferase involved in cell wall biosynthesis